MSPLSAPCHPERPMSPLSAPCRPRAPHCHPERSEGSKVLDCIPFFNIRTRFLLKDTDSSPTAQNDIFPGTRLRLGHSHCRGGFQTRPIVIGRKPSFQRFRTTGDDRKILVSTKILHFARRPFIFACRRCGLTIMAQHGKERLPSPTEEPLKAGPNGCRGRPDPPDVPTQCPLVP